MTDQVEQIQEILTERMALVGKATQLNAEQLHNTQQLSGNQFDLLRCADGLRGQPGSEQLRDELSLAEARDAALNTKIIECDGKLRALEEKIAALDRKLEAI